MSTKIKNANASTSKAATVKTKSTIDKKKVEVINLQSTLNKFADKVKDMKINEKTKKDTIYLYPENLTANEINSEKGKTFRNSLRNKLKRFENNIFVFTKTQNTESLQKEVKLFNDFYKTNYQRNDFTLASLSQSKNESKTGDLQLMLNIIVDINNLK